ncbi:MAG: hypothetical protein R3E01_28995 [Pirellulaceae bacterium]|nr:hypothetical protein [Planctomycetales bacterium]
MSLNPMSAKQNALRQLATLREQEVRARRTALYQLKSNESQLLSAQSQIASELAQLAAQREVCTVDAEIAIADVQSIESIEQALQSDLQKLAERHARLQQHLEAAYQSYTHAKRDADLTAALCRRRMAGRP